MLFIITHSYCHAQNQHYKDPLLKTWNLESMTFLDGKPYLSKEDLQGELITFKKDSIWERRRGGDKLEGIWYFNNELLVI